ncbi:unnamed protein product [Ilex paraguariensis]|uniref:Uncharacterized protein n=1 Tax=Ilex paraguariensis TaxID=185542 RepID=A0ABC8TRY6_9AQUA
MWVGPMLSCGSTKDKIKSFPLWVYFEICNAETTVINQCTQLLSPSADPTYVTTYISHSFPEHRHYLCAGSWILMHGHPENINSANLGRVLREFSPEEVTANIYTMVDVLLHHIHLELQLRHPLQDLILKACANLAYFIWTHDLLPLDILLLALIDRDDDPHALHIVAMIQLRCRLSTFFVTNLLAMDIRELKIGNLRKILAS